MDYVHLTIRPKRREGEHPGDPVFDDNIDVTEIYRLLLVTLASDDNSVYFFELLLDQVNPVIKLWHNAQQTIPVTNEPVQIELTRGFTYTISNAGPGVIAATFDKVAATVMMVAGQQPDRCSNQFTRAMSRQLAPVA